ncbi:ataxin-10 [Impatiens glandulifera]|uniref:ataxin-10 n=1 Tax=Impatiens glandulifera TaxID=253017 RepID=UPI001FB1216F|nr:ataxin-10 [Impatiens glandulifera]
MGLQMLEEPVTNPCSLPQEILHQLFVASDSSNLENALKVLIDASRTSGGRSNLASKSLLPVVLNLCQHLSKSSSSSLDLLLLSLKLLRNLCAGELINQNLFIENNGIEILMSILDSCEGVSSLPYEITRMTLQVIANVSLAGEVHQHSIWHHLFPVKFYEIAMVRRKEVSDPLCMVIYTCCDRSRVIIDQLCRDQGISILVQIIRTASEVGFDENWVKLLLSRICLEEEEEEACFPELFSALYSSGETKFMTDHVFLLSILSEILNEQLGGNGMPVSSDFASYILGIFKQSAALIDFKSGSKSSLPTGIVAVDVLGYSLTILRDICANDGPGSCIASLLSSSLMELLLQLLANLEPPESMKKPMNSSSDRSVSSGSRKAVCPYRGFRRDIVAVIGNCVYRRKEVQDEVRERKGIFVLLQQCVIDEENPFLREWGLWAVRNLLEGNMENQRFVSELELQGAADVPEISRLGLKIEVDPKTQRPKLVNLPSDCR